MRTLTLLLAGAMAAVASAQATDLIISEYVEGSSFNKYIEIYNGTGAGINLADYQLKLYANGTTIGANGTPALTGTLAAGAAIVYKHASAVLPVGATANTAVNFNGNDAIALWKISTSSFVDIFGNIGCDPGASWNSGVHSTADQTLVRNANICNGVTTNPPNCAAGFPTLASQWTTYAMNESSYLGSHIMTCGPTVNFSVASSTALESAGTVAVNMTISPITTASTTFTIDIGGSSTAAYGGGNDYITFPASLSPFTTITVTVGAGVGAASFDVIINDDLATEGDETIDFTLTNATGGTTLGSNLTHQFTITDNDNTPTIEFSTLSITALETAGPQTFDLSITGANPHPGGNVTFTVTTSGASVTYGLAPLDYTNSAGGGGGPFSRNVGIPTSTLFSFNVDPNVDGLNESTEWITFTINTVPAGFNIGANTSATFYIGDIDSPPATFSPGDLAIVGVNANDGSCGGSVGEDRVSFFCFQEITWGTEIIITDNGYERCNPGEWGNSEGTVVMRRTGPAIPAGQVITFMITGASGSGNIVSMAPDANWSCTSINSPTGNPNTAVALNVNGDQLFFMQGGTWASGTSPNNNATYSGTVLYAFSTNPTFPWSANCGSTQRSNRPPGVECFSMAPTLASDFNKYVGPTTSTTQRDWINRIDDPTNWNSYPDCGQYNSNGYNWLTAPIMPINPGAMTHGLWRGAVNSDWFECKNWDDARIPDPATNVVINTMAARPCEVGMAAGLNPGGTGVCASLLQDFNAATLRNLTVQNNSILSIGGPLTIQNTTGAGVLVTLVKADATLKATSVDIQGLNPGAYRAVLRASELNSLVVVAGDVNIGTGGLLDLEDAGVGGTLKLTGDFINTEDQTHFQENYSGVVFNGTADQWVTNPGFTENFYGLEMDKPTGDLYLAMPITVSDMLLFGAGRIMSTATELITLNSGGTAVGASNWSHVDGPMRKIGNTDFTYPIGKNNQYRPASLTGYIGSLASAFTAEYFNASPTAALGPSGLDHDATLHHVSGCEYWQIDRNGGGSPNAFVTLSWQDPISCSVTQLSDMLVAYRDGPLWTNRGNSATTGNTTAGTVRSGTIQSSFGPPTPNYWTLGSLSNENPLPIQLLSFTAQPNGGQVDLEWRTASEQNNDHFTVERSADAVTFTALLQVPGAGNSQSVIDYADVDPSPLDGLSYYRLRQTDIDGTTAVSDAVPVYFSGGHGQPLQVLYGNDGLFLMHDFAPGSTLEVMDLTGRMVGSTGITAKGPVKVPMDGLARGVYLLRMSDGARTESTRVAY